ncbi:MAG TPA: class I SAM-dependent methyltransferase [Angustibacter sp.]|nr:class I SAM-dependent methyltransferase [Angustibacter sp.]
MTDWIPPLRDALLAADYTFTGVSAVLGPTAHAALARNETTPGLRRTTGGSTVETLTRLWLLQTTVPVEAVERALPGLLDVLCAAQVLERSVGEVAARVDLRPYGTDEDNLWVIGDLTPGLDGGPNRVGPDHVLGISPAATSLAELTVRRPFDSALDLGTGCGVQSLHLAGHTRHVVATDVNRRALWMAGLNAELNSPSFEPSSIDLREGSFFEPVAGERFDLVVTNPPFVISPATGERLVYRDSGLPGDRAVEHIVREIPRHLTPGGYGQVLANWAILRDRPWDERLAEWIQPGCDAWVVQREVLDPAQYVELWLKDAGLHGAPDYLSRYDTWLSWLDEQGIEGVGFGWISLKANGGDDRRLEEWRWEVEQPLGDEVVAHFARTEALRVLTDDALLATRPRLRADVVQETHGVVGAEDPSRIVLRQQRGMRRARQVDTVEAGLAGACDGDLTVGQLLAALEQILGVDPAGPDRLDGVRELVGEGFLELG